MTRHASCCVPLCTNNFKNSPDLAFQSTKGKTYQWSENMYVCFETLILSWTTLTHGFFILLVFLEVKSPQAHLLPSASQFYVSSFISTFRFFFFRSELCHPLLSPWLLLPQGFRPEGEIPRRYSSSLRGRRLKGKGKGREREGKGKGKGRERELCEREF